MNIIFKMDLPCSKLVVANAQLGVAAYIHQANGQENINRKSVLDFADAVMETTDRIHDAAEVGDYMVEVTEDELLHLMCAVRCTFEMFISAKVETMKEIIAVHHPKIKKRLVKDALDIFFDVRKVPGLRKKPSTSELIDWLKLLMADDIPDEILKNRDPTKAIPPLYGALIKNEQDVQLLERLAFMARREASSQQ